jgi:hypothetical protein
MSKTRLGNKNALGTSRAKGQDSPTWKGGWVSKNGYRYLNVYSFGEKRQIGEHRHIMESHLGRKLTNAEHVDHINGDKLDNRLDNLRITDLKGNCHYYWGITEDDEATVLNRVKAGMTYRQAIEGTNLKSIATVLRIKRSHGLA